MTYGELKPILQPQSRAIFRVFSDTPTVIDSGAVVLFNVQGLDEAKVITLYVEDCIQRIDLKLPIEQFKQMNWEQTFGKQIFKESDTDKPFPNNQEF